MSLTHLLSDLAARDIRLRLDGEALRFSAPSGALTDDLRSRMVRHKPDLLAWLRSCEAGSGSEPKLEPLPEGAPVPLTPAQERMWFVDQLAPGNSGFNITRNVWLKGPLDAALLDQSLAMIVERHETLRTIVDRSSDEPRALVQPAGEWHLHRVNLSGADEADFTALMRQEAEHTFDLGRGPLFRATLAQKSAHEHLLLLNFHHLIFDGTSTALFFRELSAIYTALHAGTEPQVPPLPVQFGDFAAWQRQRLKGAAVASDLAYWMQQLGGRRDLAILPTDWPRSEWRTHRIAQVVSQLSKAQSEALEAFARAEGITLYMLLLGAYQLLIHRCTGHREVRVGSPVSSRTRVETEPLLGFFLNVLVMRADVSPAHSVRQFFREVKEMVLNSFAHREVPMEQLATELRADGDARGSGFFQVFFNLLNFAESDLAIPGIEARHIPLRLVEAGFELSLYIQPGADGLRAAWNYQIDLFRPETVEMLAESYLALLDAMIRNPDGLVDELPLLPETRIQKELTEPDTYVETFSDSGKLLHELFEAQGARTPNAVAVRSGPDTLSYAELNCRANQLAHHLRNRGVGRDTLVGVLTHKTPEMIIAVLAVLKAGGAYLPLDPATPPERVRLILADARARLVLTVTSLAGRLEDSGATPLCLDADNAEFSVLPATSPEINVAPASLAYAIFTSGSSGRPKGVLIEHRSIVNHTLSAMTAYGLGSSDRVLQFASLSFDASAEEIFPTLACGGELVLRSETMIETPATFLKRVAEDRLSIVNLPTAYWHELVAAMEADQLAWPECVRIAIIGGERARPDILTIWRRLLGSRVRLFNTYGPTEATVVATRWEAPADLNSLNGFREVPIGRPISNTTVLVLDRGLNPVPVGVAGELHLGGEGLARGYLNRPELTAEKFIKHPALKGARLYKTGDLVRRLADGNLEFCGRVDQQVKIRGFRIELGEIESVLARHPDVANCAVTDVDDGPEGRRLVGYVVPARAVPPGAKELRAFLLQTLPDYMVPTAFVTLDRLPVNTSGKVDRKALPVHSPSEIERDDEEFEAPAAGMETLLAKVWSETLRRERVSVTDSFFDLGGHSLLATRAVARLRHLLSFEVPLRWIFEAPTVRQLARRLEQELKLNGAAPSGERANTDAPPATLEERMAQAAENNGGPDLLPQRAPGRRLLLSDVQESLRFLQQMEPASAAYNIPALVKFSGPLQVAILSRALTELMRRHEVLRTRIVENDGEGEMLIDPPREWDLPVMNLEAHPDLDRESAARELVNAEAARAFDLKAGPLARAQLIRLDAGRHWLVINVHHIVFDGWSMEILLDELAVIYSAFLEGRASPLPESSIQFADVVLWQRDRLQGDLLAKEMAFWKEQLADVPELLELPTDFPRASAGSAGDNVEFQISPALLDRIKALAADEQGTLFMVLLGAFQVLLARASGQEEVCVGSPVAGRNRVEAESLLGYFVNTLVLRGSVAGNPSFRQFLGQVRERTLGAFGNQEVSVERLVAELNPHRDTGTSPLFQAVFVLNNETIAKSRIPGLKMTAEPVLSRTAKFDVTLVVRERPDGLRCVIEYRRGLFAKESIRRLAQRFQCLLERVVAQPDEPVGSLDLMSAAERERVLVEWNHTATKYPRQATVAELFEREVALRPAARALVMGDQRLTYGELNQRANRLAHWLRQQGVGPGRTVVVGLERSVEMIVALLAILKSGGAYVPLDMSHPPERQKFVVQDAQPVLVLTERSLARGLQGMPAPLTCLDDLCEALTQQPDANPAPTAGPTTLAYVLYTSGSTGRPKGVLVNHRAIIRLVKETQYAHFGPEEVFLQLAPVAFDASTFEIWGSLLNGSCLVILPPGLSAVTDIEAAVTRHGVTTLWLTAGLFHHLVETRVEALRGVRQLLAGGDALAPAAVRKVLRELPGCRMINGYGPTENTTFTCCHSVTSEAELATTVPIGRPIANTRVYILDRHLQPVPVGVPGELLIAGDGLADGYLNLPELTAEKFVPNPFAEAAGEKMYRSGDRVRWRADGTIEFLGRLDNQVKIRGFRIEPGEVEAVLGAMPEVQSAAVVVHEMKPGDKRLVGYYVVRDGARLSAAAVKQHLVSRLPAYLVPSALEAVETLPLTANGKVDRAALARRKVVWSSQMSHVAPRNPTEDKIARIWAAALHVERVGVEDTFFDLGGHSLVALQVVSRINQEFAVELLLRRLFETPTVAGLAAQVAALKSAHSSPVPAAGSFVSLAPLRVGGTCPPLFLLSGGDADDAELLLVSRMAQQMDADQPVYGFVARGYNGRHAPHRTVSEMARDYLAELRTVQSRGPYFLGGVCLGCLVAAEMATQLEEAGEAVAPLMFVVPRNPPSRWEVFLEMNPAGKTLRHLKRLIKMPGRDGLRYLWYRIRNAPKRLIDPLPTSGTSDYSVRAANLHALFSHSVRPFGGKAVFFMDHQQQRGSWAAHWGPLIRGGITPTLLSGDHHSCLREHSGDTARHIQEALDSVNSSSARPTPPRAES